MKIYSQKSPSIITEQYFQFDPSFGPYVFFLRQKMEESPEIIAKFYRYLIKKFQQQPALLMPFRDVSIIEEHEELLQLLTMSLKPLSVNSDSYQMALAFMQPSCIFYCTPSFKKTFVDQHIEFDTADDEVSNLRYFVKLVLERCYNIKTGDNRGILKEVRNADGETIKHYQVSVDSTYIHVHSPTVLPPYKEAWLKMLTCSHEDFFNEFSRFPYKKFRLEGFCLLTVEDVSKNMAIELLKNAILHMHTSSTFEIMEKVEQAIGELLGYPGIRIGITPFFKINGRVVHDKCCVERFVGIHSSDKANDKGRTLQNFYDRFSADPNPIILPYVDDNFLRNNPTLKGLRENKIRSFLIYPLQTADGLLGFFELGSTEEGVVSSKTIDLLQLAFPVITDLVYYMLETFHNRIDRLVKETFTPLQQSVEWKFNEVAWKYLVKEDNNQADKMENVFFEKVFPLYGSVDIKDSTIKRNLSLKNDFIIQLRATLDLLNTIGAKVSLPYLESLVHQCDKLLEAISTDLSNEHELKVREFLEEEVIVFLKSVQARLPEFLPAVQDYLRKTDPKTGEFHYYHNSYEKSFQKINETITAYFQQEVEQQLKVYPFYYEKYRTDGVEYNMYLGQSIAPEIPFDPIYLKNLRLWQLSTMAHIALANHHMLETLLLPLQTTQLILVHSHPIDVSFRKDERRFDVEGAYNIRYEMMKKRIDKVRIKDTMERLTQPDKIAIVYTNASDVDEYLHHISFLQSKNILTNDLEILELEELQGVSGLKALRAGVNY